MVDLPKFLPLALHGILVAALRPSNIMELTSADYRISYHFPFLSPLLGCTSLLRVEQKTSTKGNTAFFLCYLQKCSPVPQKKEKHFVSISLKKSLKNEYRNNLSSTTVFLNNVHIWLQSQDYTAICKWCKIERKKTNFYFRYQIWEQLSYWEYVLGIRPGFRSFSLLE